MYNKKTIPLLYTAVFGFILINKPVFADTDAGSLLNREEEIYKFNKNPQKIPQIDKNKKSPPEFQEGFFVKHKLLFTLLVFCWRSRFRNGIFNKYPQVLIRSS